MQRRALLTLVGSSLAAVAGCSGRADESTDRPQSNQTQTDTPRSNQTPTDTPTPAEETSSENLHIDVELTTAQYRVHADEVSHLAGINQNYILPAEDRHPDFETAIREARDDGEFQTENPSEGLLQSIDDFRRFGIGYRYLPYVELDGHEYEFTASVPEYVYRLAVEHPDAEDPEDADVDSDRVAHYEDDVKSARVEAFVDTLAHLTPHSPRDPYRRSVVPAEVLDFVEAYDYLRTPQRIAPIETDFEDPGAPYTVTVEVLTESDLWGQEVREIDEFEPELRPFLTAAITSPQRAETIPTDQREFRTDEVPDRFWQLTTDSRWDIMNPYVRYGGDVYEIEVEEPDRDHPIDLTVTPVPDEDRPAVEITVSPDETVTNGDEVVLQSHGLLPSVLWVVDGGERRRLETPVDDRIEWQELNQDETNMDDEEDEHAKPDRIIVNRRQDSLTAGQSLTRTYTVPEAVSDGRYRAWASLEAGLNVPHYDTTIHPFGVLLEIDTE